MRSTMIVCTCLWAFAVASAYSDPSPPSQDLTQLSIEELMQIEVVTASKKAQPVWDVPASVYVITAEDIHRMGATSIPEVLRLVPGVHVGIIDASKWSVAVRGFNGRYSNKLLVLMDGRSVYTPFFSGVYWDAQPPLFMEDIERIEVIRGPGAALWGANAVNGVINIITKSAGKLRERYGYRAVGVKRRPSADGAWEASSATMDTTGCTRSIRNATTSYKTRSTGAITTAGWCDAVVFVPTTTVPLPRVSSCMVKCILAGGAATAHPRRHPARNARYR